MPEAIVSTYVCVTIMFKVVGIAETVVSEVVWEGGREREREREREFR